MGAGDHDDEDNRALITCSCGAALVRIVAFG